MANKYIRHGETYCGDGTSPASATSDGGVGAWNNINVLEGTAPAYGALAAGDVVYIRSKDASGNDIVRSLTGSVTVGSSAASSVAPITWVLDDGTVWPGVKGTLAIRCSVSYDYNMTGANHNRFYSATKGAWSWEYTDPFPYGYVKFGDSCLTKGLKISFPNRIASSSNGGGAAFSSGVHYGMTISGKNFSGGIFSVPVKIYQYSQQGSATFIDLTIDIAEAATNGLFSIPVGYGIYPGKIRVVGGRLTGAGATTACRVLAGDCSGEVLLENFLIPATVRRLASSTERLNYFGAATNVDGVNGTHMAFAWGEADSRQDGFYPYLNAKLPDGEATGWSWRVYPYGADEVKPIDLHSNKFHVGATGQCAVTQELLVSDNFTPDANSLWMDVCYIDDSTGLLVVESTKGVSGAVAASTATWIAAETGGKPTYGPTAFDKKKIVLTTAGPVRNDTMVGIFVHSALLATAETHLLFIDPDPSIVVV